ncbi:hypothetical protein SAMN06265784_102776 [Paraburkholderia susongensis]|uniref:Uncharacterized protein n=1 Tax=Paraburkholderia susongensis TaxID=1515439 RepID=A0A1X7JL49_9BURK|nr:hypothetical protein SAMN06265784_102776 [Paraburkholderia susongensis]
MGEEEWGQIQGGDDGLGALPVGRAQVLIEVPIEGSLAVPTPRPIRNGCGRKSVRWRNEQGAAYSRTPG